MATKKTTKPGKPAKSAAPTKAPTKAPAKSATQAAPTTVAASPKRSRTKAAITKPVAAAKAARLVSPPPAAELNKKALVERFMEESGMKKGDARNAVDAMLTVLHGAIGEGLDIAAAPLGKIKIVRKKETPNGELAVLRVKLRDPSKMPASAADKQAGNQGVADAAE